MIDLIYPYDDAPVLPTPTAETTMQRPSATEYFPVIEQTGIVVGRSSRQYCHGGEKPLHPVIHIHIIDRQGRIYLQKRSMKKDIQPGKWDTAVGGHVSYGETILEAVYREASEELGLTAFHPLFLTSYVFESEIERELVNVFAAVGSFDLKPDLDEVDEGHWWPVEEINGNIGRSVFTPNFESEYSKIAKNLLALL
jgi:isopentenyldiphosphate isomerase